MKYVCPVCQSQLKFWKDYGFEKQRLVNENTGILNKKITKTNEYEDETSGLSCTSCDFHYYSNYHNKIEYSYLDNIFELMDE